MKRKIQFILLLLALITLLLFVHYDKPFLIQISYICSVMGIMLIFMDDKK